MANISKPKHAILLFLQVLFLAFAAFCVYSGFSIIGMLALFGALVLDRRLRHLRFPALRHSKPPFSVTKRQWLAGLAFFAALAVATVWLFHDAATGYGNGVVRLYTFLFALLLCSLWCGGLFIRWFLWWF